jgi:hypothetical protein
MTAVILSHSRTIFNLGVSYPEHVSPGEALDKWAQVQVGRTGTQYKMAYASAVYRTPTNSTRA